jgi:GT2 family glycosyltransferase
MTLAVSVVIPTKNRPDDLALAVASVLSQTKPPSELIVVDQSPGPESENKIRSFFDADGGSGPTRLVYIHDTEIVGLVDAKRVASARAVGDVVCFLEDDVTLEPNYLACIEGGFHSRPDMCGCSGVITNPPRSSPLYRAAHALFFRGIFYDPRVALTARALRGSKDLIPCDILSGGLSCWRKHVFDRVRFDTRNGFFWFEDMEFATRVVRAMGHHLYINPQARLEHHGSPVNRDVHGMRQRRKMTEAVVFYKTRREWPGAHRGLVIALVWWLGEAMLAAVHVRSTGPLSGYVRGVLDGMRKPLQLPDTLAGP